MYHNKNNNEKAIYYFENAIRLGKNGREIRLVLFLEVFKISCKNKDFKMLTTI
jgi:hypothetical protein